MIKTDQKYFFNLVFRYISLLVIAIIFSFSDIIYNFLLLLTIYPTNFLLNLFFPSIVYGNNILIQSQIISIIPACVAVSAYLLLIILNLTISLKPLTRLYSILFSVLCLLIVNILRIVIFSLLLLQDFKYYQEIHMFFWYILSTIFVVGIWFLTAYLFKIKNLPIYEDFKQLINKAK